MKKYINSINIIILLCLLLWLSENMYDRFLSLSLLKLIQTNAGNGTW